MVEPMGIEKKSMEIIDGLIGTLSCTPDEAAVIKRMVHTTGDPEYAKLVRFHPEATIAGIAALKRGCKIFTDVNMVLAGINKARLSATGGTVECGIASPEVAKLAKETGETRAMTAMQNFGPQLHQNIVVIGNAPTALFQVLQMVESGIKPALIVGTPVGFVGAAESKEELLQCSVPFITVTGYKGGSGVAAAAINALLIQLG